MSLWTDSVLCWIMFSDIFSIVSALLLLGGVEFEEDKEEDEEEGSEAWLTLSLLVNHQPRRSNLDPINR